MPAGLLNAPLVLVPQFFGSMVYDRASCQYLPFDAKATDILVNLAQKPLSDVLRETNEEERHTIIAFFDRFQSLGFFTVAEKFAGAILPLSPAADHLTGPLTLHLELTRACNLHCLHCFAGEKEEHGAPLSDAELSRLFAEMAALGTFRLGLTGGEPLLRHDLLDIVDMAIAQGLSPCLTTNGLLLDDQTARALGRRNLAWLNVSLEGASAATHDDVRGTGTFAMVVEKIKLLARHARFSLAFTVMRSNLHEAEACVELAHMLGAQAAVFRPLYPVGEACRHPELFISFADYLTVLKRLRFMHGNTWSFCSAHPWGPHSRADSEAVVYANFGCGAANLVCSVSATGNVSPCSFLGEKFVAGNLRRQSLSEIWHASQIFTTMRALTGESKCAACDDYATCSGGCRARALAWRGDINDADPWCTV
jgi:radical SAM protein with 4Fe4S-binding SPASM domain